MHYCLLFAIHIYFSDIFLDFLLGLDFTDNNLRHVSCGLNFTNGKFLFYFMQITFCGKIQNLRNLQNRIHAGHGVKVGPGLRDPPQSLKVGPGTPLKFKSGTPGPPSKFKIRNPAPPSKFKSGTLKIIFLHRLTYFVLDKYIYIIWK